MTGRSSRANGPPSPRVIAALREAVDSRLCRYPDPVATPLREQAARLYGVSPDMVLCGNLSIDGSTAQVCSQLAEFLDLPNVMHVIGLDWEDSNLIITRKIEHGYTRLKASPPLVISVRKELNKPRYIPFTGIIAAETKEIKVVSSKDLQLDSTLIGLEGSPTKMAGLEIRRFQRARETLEGSVEEKVEKLADRIYQYGII